ncbi:MAG: hypothetical protein CM15mP120_01120 [Pseudomonadota bacterium]|nr:MAG: hypothetical protein CM15mP120_01120 [Pseudomonadota bacterium]
MLGTFPSKEKYRRMARFAGEEVRESKSFSKIAGHCAQNRAK